MNWHLNKTDLADGNYLLRVYGNDTSDNWNSTEMRVIEIETTVPDTTPPIIEFVPQTPGNNSILTENHTFINITVNENLSTAVLEWNGVNESMDGAGMNWYLNKTNLTDGNYSFRVYGNDTSDNWNATETRVVQINTTIPDTTPPIIEFIPPTPGNNSILTENHTFINITANENLSTAMFEWNGVNESMGGAGMNWYLNKTDLADGNYLLRVYGNDTSDNWNSTETRVVQINTTAPDTGPPVITNVTATDITNNSARITWDSNEPSDSLVKFGIESENYTHTRCNVDYVISHIINLTGLNVSTTYYYIVKSTDISNNSNQSIEHSFTTLTPPNLFPIADVKGPYTGYEGSPIIFNGSGSYDPDDFIICWEWDLDGDGIYETNATETNGSVNHAWGDNYVGNVSLKVTDSYGAIDTGNTTVTVLNVAPVVDAGPDQEVFANEAVNFNGSFIDPGRLDTHSIEWIFGDGYTAIGTLTPTHSYPEKGVYNVTLTVTDDDCGIGNDTTIITVLAVYFAYDLKEGAITDLEAIDTTNKHTQKAIDDAIKNIKESLEKSLWLDTSHLDPKHGHKVFNEEKNAVKHMMKITDGKGEHDDPAIVDELKAVTSKITKADEQLAMVAINDAKNTPVQDPKFQDKVDFEIAHSEEELIKAAEELSKDQPDNAIDHYKKAWEHAQQAIMFAQKSTGNFDEAYEVHQDTEGIPYGYKVDQTWFDWTSKEGWIGSGGQAVPLNMRVIGGVTGYKGFCAVAEFTRYLPVQYDTGILFIL